MPPRTLSTLALVSLLAIPVQAQEPSLDQVLERHLEALGGAERLAALETLEKRGLFVYNGREFPLTSYHAHRARLLREEITGLDRWATRVLEDHTRVRAVVGDVAWMEGEEQPARPRPLSAAAARALAAEAALCGTLAEARERGYALELLGPSEVEGAPTLRLRVDLGSGNAHLWDLDARTYLPRRLEAQVAGVEGLDSMQVGRIFHFDDFREVAGVQMPFWVHVEELLFSREYVYEEIRANVEIPPGKLEPPNLEAPTAQP